MHVDMFENELKIGDFVVYPSMKADSTELTCAKIKALTLGTKRGRSKEFQKIRVVACKKTWWRGETTLEPVETTVHSLSKVVRVREEDVSQEIKDLLLR